MSTVRVPDAEKVNPVGTLARVTPLVSLRVNEDGTHKPIPVAVT